MYRQNYVTKGIFSHDVEMNNKGILHLHLHTIGRYLEKIHNVAQFNLSSYSNEKLLGYIHTDVNVKKWQISVSMRFAFVTSIRQMIAPFYVHVI